MKFKPKEFENGNTLKLLLARSRYILARKDWTDNQATRATILYDKYPELKRAYNHCMGLRNIYENKRKIKAYQKIKKGLKTPLNYKKNNFISPLTLLIIIKKN